MESFTDHLKLEKTRMKPTERSFKGPVLAFATVALCIAASSVPAAAQSERCTDLHGRVIALYQTAPYSPEYSRMANYYSSGCLAGGPSAGPDYPAYQTPNPGTNSDNQFHLASKF